MMLSEIGSNFWIDPNEVLKDEPIGTPEQFGCKGHDYVWLSTGRSAITYAIQIIERQSPQLKKKAVLPLFTCHTVIDPFLNAGFDVRYYKVEKDLSVSPDDILKTVIDHDASIVLFHRYFGFDTFDGQVDMMCDTLRQLGKYTIEDCTQCLYSDFPKSSADFFVGSIRKWHGTPDGGFVVSRNVILDNKPLQTDLRLERAKVEASYAKYNYLFKHNGDKTAFLRMYRLAEDILVDQKVMYTISKTSCELQSNLDVGRLKKKRKSNYKVLLSGLECFGEVKPLFNRLSDNVVPLYFPIYVVDRLDLQKYLVENNIYAPVVWPKAECLGEKSTEADDLYDNLLCIPIDQRYDVDDMKRILKTINIFYKK